MIDKIVFKHFIFRFFSRTIAYSSEITRMMACEKETKGKDTFEPMVVEGKLEVVRYEHDTESYV